MQYHVSECLRRRTGENDQPIKAGIIVGECPFRDTFVERRHVAEVSLEKDGTWSPLAPITIILRSGAFSVIWWLGYWHLEHSRTKRTELEHQLAADQ